MKLKKDTPPPPSPVWKVPEEPVADVPRPGLAAQGKLGGKFVLVCLRLPPMLYIVGVCNVESLWIESLCPLCLRSRFTVFFF